MSVYLARETTPAEKPRLPLTATSLKHWVTIWIIIWHFDFGRLFCQNWHIERGCAAAVAQRSNLYSRFAEMLSIGNAHLACWQTKPVGFLVCGILKYGRHRFFQHKSRLLESEQVNVDSVTKNGFQHHLGLPIHCRAEQSYSIIHLGERNQFLLKFSENLWHMLNDIHENTSCLRFVNSSHGSQTY